MVNHFKNHFKNFKNKLDRSHNISYILYRIILITFLYSHPIRGLISLNLQIKHKEYHLSMIDSKKGGKAY